MSSESVGRVSANLVSQSLFLGKVTFSELIGAQLILPVMWGTTLASINIELPSLRASRNSVGRYLICFGLSEPKVTTVIVSGWFSFNCRFSANFSVMYVLRLPESKIILTDINLSRDVFDAEVVADCIRTWLPQATVAASFCDFSSVLAVCPDCDPVSDV